MCGAGMNNRSIFGNAMTPLSGSPSPKRTALSMYIDFLLREQSYSVPPQSSEEQFQLFAALQKATPESTPTQKRGSEGCKGTKWGEPRLMEIVLEFFEKYKKPEMCDGINHLYDEHLDLIREAWTKYTNELESGQRYGNRTLTYGKLLTPGGMRRKLHQWAKKPSFRERLVKLGYLKA